ncbi:MAG: hypothetical protein V4616_12740 [Bacteroidota bacterium]
MLIAVNVISCILLVLVLVEDLKFRAVHAWIFPLLCAAFIFLRMNETAVSEVLTDTALNTALIALNLLLATLYFSLKNRKPVKLTGGFIGWGDLFFFIAIAPLFPFRQFVFVFPLSLLFSLIMWLGLSQFSQQRDRKVPLAGLQALFVLGWMGATAAGFVDSSSSPDFFTVWKN